jgi:hypothetical protein
MNESILADREDTTYERLAQFSGKLFGSMVKEPETPDTKEAIDFTGLRVTPVEVESFAIFSAIAIGALFAFLTVLSFMGIIPVPWYFMILLTIGGSMGAYAYYTEYAKSYANVYRIKAVGSMPELISNLSISLKLVPNLENAAAFASRTTRGHMGVLLKRLIWGTYSRTYSSAEVAIVSLADGWKKWNDDFSRALYLLRTSLEERSETRRLQVLDKAVDTILKGTSEKIDDFASSLYMPTMTLYFLGVILPLLMIAVLPVLAFQGGLSLGSSQLALIYIFLIPTTIFLATNWILNRRPVTIPPPDIKEHPEIPPEGVIWMNIGGKITALNGIILALIVSVPFLALGFYGLAKFLGKQDSLAVQETTVGSVAIGQPTSFLGKLDQYLMVFILIGFALGIFVYFVGINWQRKKVREEVLQTEREFIDSLTQLGNRLSDGDPFEAAIVHVSKVMGDSKISKIYSDAAKAIMVGRASVNSAFFDDKRGALIHVYSDTIRNVIYKVVEGIQKGSQTASITVFRTVEQLQKVQDIERNMKKKLEEVVTPMRLIIVGVGPLVAGVVVVLQNMISGYLIKSQGFSDTGSSNTGAVDNPFGAADSVTQEFATKSIPSEMLLMIVGIYLVLMVIILSRYMSGINNGEDKVASRIEIGVNLIASITLYAVTIMIAGFFLGSAGPQI